MAKNQTNTEYSACNCKFVLVYSLIFEWHIQNNYFWVFCKAQVKHKLKANSHQVLIQGFVKEISGRSCTISPPKLPKKIQVLPILSKPYSVLSSIGSRMNRMLFHSFWKQNRLQKNTSTVYHLFQVFLFQKLSQFNVPYNNPSPCRVILTRRC